MLVLLLTIIWLVSGYVIFHLSYFGVHMILQGIWYGMKTWQGLT
jgi:hypothetical protein